MDIDGIRNEISYMRRQIGPQPKGDLEPPAIFRPPQDWLWSSTRAQLRGKDDGVTALAPIRERFPRFADLRDNLREADLFARLRAAERCGRPFGDDPFIARVKRSRPSVDRCRRANKVVVATKLGALSSQF
jgi:hypothetical protein